MNARPRHGTASQRVGIREVAARAGVSTATVSKVLNGGTGSIRVSADCADRVRRVAAELGYVGNHQARSIRRGRSETLAICFGPLDASQAHPERPLLAGTYHNAVIAGIEDHARSAGLVSALVGPAGGRDSLRRGIDGLRSGRYDGLIAILGQEPLDAPRERELAGLPAILVEPGSSTAAGVASDEDRVVELAVGHLRDLGHRRLGWVGPGGDAARDPYRQRERRLVDAAERAGLTLRVQRYPNPTAGSADHLAATLAAAHATVASWADDDLDGCSALVCFNDLVAIGACAALREHGLAVPRDCSVLGIDDVEARLTLPALSSIDRRLGDLGRRACERLLACLANDGRASGLEIVPPRLMARVGTKNPPLGGFSSGGPNYRISGWVCDP